MKKIFCLVLPRITPSFGLLAAMTLHASIGHAATNWADWTSIGTDTANHVGSIPSGASYTYVTSALGTLQDAATSATANLNHTGEVIETLLGSSATYLSGFSSWTDAGAYYPSAS